LETCLKSVPTFCIPNSTDTFRTYQDGSNHILKSSNTLLR
jgi:hypothetical protein